VGSRSHSEEIKGDKMTERKMATIRKIAEIQAIPEADLICAYRVDGWWVVDQVGKYVVGDLVVYAEPDSWIPVELAPFLCKGKEPREYNGVKGEKLRTIRLKKQLSQGLLLPLEPTCANIESMLFEGLDVSFPLNIQKYEAPIAAQLAGLVRGNFPSRIPKTDQERIQNLPKELEFWKEKKFTWEETEKLDGSSMTVYLLDDEFGVCSRNLDLKRDENNSLWKVAIRYDLEKVLRDGNEGLALQGEIVGNGIQGNPYMFKDQEFYIFDIYNVLTGKYFTPTERKAFITKYNLKHVPVFNSARLIETETIADLLALAEGKSVMGNINGPEREGLVFKCNECEASFKVISNRFLLKAKD
jgi:RNA ligase (TIGR02306 family)